MKSTAQMRGMDKGRPPVDFGNGVAPANDAANADRWTAAPRRPDVQAPATARISLTSFAVCVGILAWAIVNAYLS